MTVIKYRGRLVMVSDELPNELMSDVKRQVVSRIDYELDEAPLKRKQNAAIKILMDRYDEARMKALENVRFIVNPSLLMMMDEYGLTELLIEKESLIGHPISTVVPQLNMLCADMTVERQYLDKKLLNDYWDAKQKITECYNDSAALS